MEIIVEKALPEDITRISEIERGWDRRNLPADAMVETGALNLIIGAEKLSQYAQNSQALVLVARQQAGESREIVGFLLAYAKDLTFQNYVGFTDRFPEGDHRWQQDFLYVKTVAVDPASQGQGVGKKLLEVLRQEAVSAGVRQIFEGIAVEPANQRSLKLFSGVLGVKEVSRSFDAESGITWGMFASEIA